MFNANNYSHRELIELEIEAKLLSEATDKEEVCAYALQLVEEEAYTTAEAVAEAILHVKLLSTTPKYNSVYKPNGKRKLDKYALAEWVGNGDREYDMSRIEGEHCNCGAGRGEFELLPTNHVAVVEGGKDYMVCRECGYTSHL